MFYTFYKAYSNQWFIDLPEWEGELEDLEMVSGADTMLDIIAQGRDRIRIRISTEPREDDRFMLTYLEDAAGGANYLLTSEKHSFDVWLCHVTKYVFGELPKRIYIQ